MQKRLLFLMTMLLTLSLTAMAQITTSSMAGKVTYEGEDDAIIGASIQAVHEPSGTRYATVTNVSGRFSIQGMRTGGPYTVTVSYIGYETKTLKNIVLELGETYELNVWLSENATAITEVVISGKATKFTAEKTGATTNITSAQMTALPSVTRNITDMTRLSPYGGNGMSFAGSDGRMGNFTVDGANFNNNFGLSDKLPGGGSPISIDAIEEMQVVISPFDVRQTNFIGGGVNAITKSGTNKFKGTAYIYHSNENMRGDAIERQQISSARDKSQSTTYGFTLGGPIIKNKLFFFVNGEKTTQPTVVNRWRASEDGVADANNYVSRTTVADLQAVKDFVKREYGYDTGSYTNFPAEDNNYKLLARLDWNITDRHHLALRYNYTKNSEWHVTNGSSMDGGERKNSSPRFSQYSMGFVNSLYSLDNNVNSFSLDLNSRLTDNLSNQLLVTYSQLDDVRGSQSDPFPFIDILKDDANYIALGYELFTWYNGVHNNVWTAKDDVTWYAGKHKVMAGINYEYQMADNAYLRNGTGYYRYNSLDDFLNKRVPEVVALTYGYDGEENPAATVRYNKLGVYGQDEWNIKDNFKLTYGLRIDGLFYNENDIMTNNAIFAFDYAGKRIDTGKWPDTNISFSPRVGFSWDVFGDKSLKVRGGSGFFSGRLPLVFFTNMPTNSNMVQYKGIWNATGANSSMQTDMSIFDGGLVTDANGKPTIAALRDFAIDHNLGPRSISPEDGVAGSSIAGVDPKFKMPQVWKTSVAVDYQVPVSFPLTVTVEGIFNKMINDVCISDWSIKYVGGFARLNGVDNRPMYEDYKLTYTDNNGKTKNMPAAFILTNTSKGYKWTGNITVNAQPVDWLNIMASYTHTVAKELTGMPGSDASSAYTYIPTVEGPNFMRLHSSDYVTPDRFITALTYTGKNDQLSIIYETWRGGEAYNYSPILDGDMNGDGYAYDLIYIPTDQQVADREFRFATDDDRDRFMAFVHNNSFFEKQQGSYAEPYSMHSPWVHHIDLAYKHDFRLKLGETAHKLQLSLDMKNVMNFFNSSWGVRKYLNPNLGNSKVAKLLTYNGVDGEGYGVFSTPKAVNGDTKVWVPNHAIGQCWYASVGIKYFFN